jgi:hypothetical protein
MPATAPERERHRRLLAAYGPREALGYPLRGLGQYLFFGWIAIATLRHLPGPLGFWPWVVSLAVAVLAPGLLLAIVRTTMEGATELPDWPDFFEAGERMSEIGACVLLAVVAMLPAIALLGFVGCRPETVVAGAWAASCWWAVFVGIAAGVPLGLGGLATVAVTQSAWSALRLDLHLRLLAATAPDSWRAAGSVAGLLIASEVLQLVLRPLPVVGGIAAAALGIYGVLLAPHLLGLVLRRRMPAVEGLYGRV